MHPLSLGIRGHKIDIYYVFKMYDMGRAYIYARDLILDLCNEWGEKIMLSSFLLV